MEQALSFQEASRRSLFAARKNPIVRDMTNLLWGQLMLPDQRVLQVGCGPGKLLLWSALYCRSIASGLESSPSNYGLAKQNFQEADIKADLRQEDILYTTFPAGGFDLVYSINAITHLSGDHLESAVRKHVDLVRHHGEVLIVVPNFESIYGLILKWRDPEAYASRPGLTRDTLLRLVPSRHTATVYPWGKFSPTVVSHYPPRGPVAAYLLRWLDMLGAIQPFRIGVLCPWLVLHIRRV